MSEYDDTDIGDDDGDDGDDISEEGVRKPQRGLPTPSQMHKHLDESRSARRRTVQMWNMCLDFLGSEQNRVASLPQRDAVAFGGRFERPRIQLVRNQLAPIYRTTCEMLAARYPALSAVPMSADWGGIQKAIATQQAMKAIWTMNDMTRVLDRCVQYLSPTGNVALHTYFEPKSTKVCIEAVSPYNVLAEKGVENLEESKWVAIRRVYTREALIDIFPKDEKFIMSALAMDDSDRDMMRPREQATLDDRLPVFYVYKDAGRDSPKVGILLRNKWLWKGETPAKVKSVHLMRFMPIVGRFHGVSQMELLLDPQRAYNEFVNFAIDIARMTSNPVWVVASNSGVSANDITNAPGAVIRYNGNATAPSRQQAPAVPPHLFDLQGRSLAEMQDLAGIHASSMGKRSTGIVSNVAMEQLAARDAGQMYLVRSEMEYAVVGAMKDALTLWRYYMPDEVNVAMMDERIGTMVNEAVRGTELMEYPQLLIEPGTMFQAVKRDRDERILNLATAGFIPPEEAMKEISLPHREMQAMNKAVGLRHAKWLLDKCREGKFIEVFPEDDIDSIAEVFKEFINGPSYYEAHESASNMATLGIGDPQQVQIEIAIANYIREVYVAVTTPLDQPPEMIQQRMQQNVFPRQPSMTPPQQMPGGTPGQQAPRQEQVQQARQQQDVQRPMPGTTGAM